LVARRALPSPGRASLATCAYRSLNLVITPGRGQAPRRDRWTVHLVEEGFLALPRDDPQSGLNVGFWHLADILLVDLNVRF
jgi:hypothetical protein